MNKKEQLFIMLNIIDFCTTSTLLSMGGEELMPLGLEVIKTYGMLGLLLYKLVVSLSVIYVLRFLNPRERVWDLLNGAFTGIVLWNNLGIFLSIFM
tara:strand:- start:345 stop:632 length:288 start_codon:yes stop_codon:yes gene_type:complete